MSFSLFNVLNDHRDPLVAQLAQQLARTIPEFGRLPKKQLKEEVGHLFDGIVDLIGTGDQTKLETYFNYLVRRTQQGVDLGAMVKGLLLVPTTLRGFLQAAFREQIIGGGRAAFEESIVADACEKIVFVPDDLGA